MSVHDSGEAGPRSGRLIFTVYGWCRQWARIVLRAWNLLKIKSVSVVDEPVEDGVGERGIVQVERPLLDRYQLWSNRTVVLSGGRGALSGKTGDWLVDYGCGDLSLVSERLFESYYKVVDDEGNPLRA